MIESIFNYLHDFLGTPNMWFNFTTIVLAVAGLLYGFIKDYIHDKKKQPVYWIRTTHLVRETFRDLQGIQILYNGKEVSDLSSTKFIFWNKGKDAIKQTDVASKNPIKISIDSEYEILDAFIDKTTNDDNNFTISMLEDRKSVIIDFEFMEQNDGVNIVLTHTAPSSDKFRVTGKVISGSKIQSVPSVSFSHSYYILNRKLDSKRFHYSTKVLTILGGLFFISIQFALIKENDLMSYVLRTIFIAVGLFYIYVALFVIRRRIPQKLDNEE